MIMADVTILTNYINDFVPFEIYVVFLIGLFVFIALSIVFMYKREGIVFSAVSMIIGAFCLFSCFFLRVGRDVYPELINGDIVEIQTICTSTGLLYLHLGLFVLSIVMLWINVANYTKRTMIEAEKKNKELVEGDGIK